MAGASILNLNDTAPAAPSGEQNVHWQKGTTTGNDPVTGYPVFPASANVPNTGGAVVKTANYTATAADCGRLLAFNSATPVTLTLPATAPVVPAGSSPSQWQIDVENFGAGALTIDRNGLNIDGAAANLTLSQNQGLTVETDGANYFTQRGAGSFTSPLTAKGDVFTRSSTADARLAVGANGTVLMADSAQTTGNKWIALAESDITGLVSDLALKAPLASPALTGTPTVPTAAPGTSTTQAASTAFVGAAITAAGGGTWTEEVPTGTLNGTNTSFTLSHTPIAGSLTLFLNIVQREGTDFTISTNTITFTVAPKFTDTGWFWARYTH